MITKDNCATEPDPDDNELRIDQEKIYAEPNPDDILDIRENMTHIINIIREPAVNDEPDPMIAQTMQTHKSIVRLSTNLILMIHQLLHLLMMLKLVYQLAMVHQSNLCFLERSATHQIPMTLKNVALMDGKQMKIDEPDPDDNTNSSDNEELQIIEEPAAAICARLRKAIALLRPEAHKKLSGFLFRKLIPLILVTSFLEHT
ncbi:hypothetical protein IHE45_03G083900 [Dioscorea alata]|uniref:Uncharacterized protein n=1 Tax=Dioscorea alata TaxID=55571 RepID=A0ACB7WMV3_DIOAL|nr:hypothetical protein IHE45_03G083900 [Dioscorea alata]